MKEMKKKKRKYYRYRQHNIKSLILLNNKVVSLHNFFSKSAAIQLFMIIYVNLNSIVNYKSNLMNN